MNTTYLTVLDLLAKSAGILLLTFAVQSLWRRASAAQCCLLWTASFLVLLLLPLGALLRPLWTVDVLAPNRPVVVAMSPTVVFDESIPTSTPVVAEVPAPRRLLPELTTAQWLGVIWFTGVMSLLGYRLLGSVQLRRLRRQSRALENVGIQRLALRLQKELGVSRPVELREAACVSIPLTWGIMRPVILLPEAATAWSQAKLEAALRHELGHVRHFDALTRLLISAVCALQWPNVLIWFAAKSWRTAQEQACDDLVVSAGASSENYALQLLEAARAVQSFGLKNAPVLAMARVSTLETRVTAIMDEKRERRAPGGRMFISIGLLSMAVLGFTSALQLRGIEEAGASQVVIDAQIMEAKGDAIAAQKEILAHLGKPDAPLSEAEAQDLIKKLEGLKGLDLLAAPRITTLSGQAANISVGAEVVTDAATGRKEFVGLKIDVLATVENGAIKIDAKALSRERDGSSMRDWQAASVATLQSGQTLILRGDSTKESGKNSSLLCLLTARSSPAPEKLHTQAMAEKIILPKVAFQHASVAEAVQFLKLKAAELDPAKKGVNIIVRSSEVPDTAEISLDLTDIPLAEAVKYTAELSGRMVKYEPFAIVLAFPGHDGAELLTREYRVKPEAAAKIGDAQTWLARQGVSFPTGASASLSPQKDRMTVKAAGPELNKLDALLVTLVDDQPRPEPEAVKAAKAIIFPTVQFREASVQEAVEFFRLKARDLDPTKQGVNIVLKSDAALNKAQLTLDLKDVPLMEALRYVAALAGLELKAGDYAITLEAPQTAPGSSKSATTPAPATSGAATETAASKAAKAIILPSVQFREASIQEAVEFLRIKARDLDPSKKGVNIILKPDPSAKAALLTLDLKNIPVMEALKYVASLADLEIKVGESAISLESKSTK